MNKFFHEVAVSHLQAQGVPDNIIDVFQKTTDELKVMIPDTVIFQNSNNKHMAALCSTCGNPLNSEIATLRLKDESIYPQGWIP